MLILTQFQESNAILEQSFLNKIIPVPSVSGRRVCALLENQGVRILAELPRGLTKSPAFRQEFVVQQN
jgi:hypothetical protein